MPHLLAYPPPPPPPPPLPARVHIPAARAGLSPAEQAERARKDRKNAKEMARRARQREATAASLAAARPKSSAGPNMAPCPGAFGWVELKAGKRLRVEETLAQNPFANGSTPSAQSD